MATTFTDFLARREQEAGRAARTVVAEARQVNPDQAAEQQRLARRYSAPAAAVAHDPDAYRNKAAGEDTAAALTGAPRTATWLSQRNNAAVAHDDVGVLGTIENWFSGLTPKNVGKALVAGVYDIGAGVGGLVRAATEGPFNPLSAVNPALGAIAEGANDLAGGRLRKVTQDVATAGSNASSKLAKDMRPKASGVVAQGVLAGVESIPVTAASIALGIAGSPAAGLGFAGATAGGMSYQKGREEGLTPEAAFAYGGIDAAVEVATERLPLLRFLEDTKVGTPFMKRFARNLVSENAGEQVATAAQDFNAWAFIDANKGKTFGDYLRERPEAALQTLLATTTSVGAINVATSAAERAAGKVQARVDRANAAAPQAEQLAQVAELAAASKLRNRDVETFESFMRQAAEDGPVQEVFVDARTLMDTLNQAGVDSEEVIASVPALAEQIETALATGGDLRIPVEQFAARMGGTEVGQQLVQHLRVDPNDMSQAEAQTFFQSAPQELRDAVEREIQRSAVDDEWTASRDRVKEQVLGELTRANRFTPDVNDAYASLTSNFFAVMAARAQVTPEELAQRYGLKVSAEEASGSAVFGQANDARQLAVDTEDTSPNGDEEVDDYDWSFVDLTPEQLKQVLPQYEEQSQRLNIDPTQSDLSRPVVASYDDQGRLALWDGVHRSLSAIARGEPVRASIGTPRNRLNQSARGQIAFANDITSTPSIITMFRGADLSTFLHESGHFYLEVMADMAARPDAPAEVAADMQKTLDWFGVADLAAWRGMTLDQKREHHEAFARGFEAYLFEGKAPNLGLRGIFQRFRAWLVNVYRDISRLNVELTDEARGVFDRMVATTEMIRDAEEAAGLEPILTEKPAGMTDEEYREYQELGLQATQEAIGELESRSVRDMQWAGRARSRELKRLQKDADAKRKAVRAEAEADVAGRPLYRAIDFLRRGMLDGEAVDGPHKFDIAAIDALYEGYNTDERDLVKRTLGYGKYGMLSKENGIHPQQVADLFGFTSADHLIGDLIAAPSVDSVVDAEVEQRLLERYGDITSPQALEAAVSEALHNDVRARFVATEMAALSRSPGKPRLLAQAAKRFAEQMIARQKVRDIRPAQYEAAERRASRAAQTAVAAGDQALAATEKRNQLVNLSATKAARLAQDEIAKAVEYLRKFDREGTRKGLDVDYIEQIDAITERYELRPSVSGRAMDRRKSLVQWVEAQRDAGFEPTIDEAVLDEARRVHYRDLTLEELRGVIDAVRNIEHLGRLKKKLLTAKDDREFAAAADEMESTVRANTFRSVKEIVGTRTRWEKALGGAAKFFAIHRKIASLVREMDGFKDGGPIWERLIRPMNEAGDREAVMTEQATMALGEIFKPIYGRNLNRRTYVPEIGRSLSTQDRLMIALNQGNETNRLRVVEGDKWTPEQVQAILAPLTREQWQFVQDTWDYINSFWPQIAAKERRVTGVTPGKVEADPFTVTTADGQTIELRGGYFPIKYDPDRSSKSEADSANEVAMQLQRGLYTRAQTRRGHTKERVTSVKRPVRKDFGVVFEHVAQVIHDLTWHEYLIDANRLLRNGGVDNAIREGWGPAVVQEMRDTLTAIAVGDMGAQNVLERGVNYLRTGATIAGLGWNLMTSLLQPLGLTQSMQRIGPKWVGVGIARVFKDAASMDLTTTWIYERSDFMRLRAKTMQREISEIRNQVSGKSGTRLAVEGSYFTMIAKLQLMADVPTWVGQYEKSMAGGESEERAAALADQAVIDSQGGGQIKDLAGLQRGSPFQKLWTNFYSYFSVTYNRMAEAVNETRAVGPERLPYLAIDFMMLAILPAALTTLMRAAITGGDDDDWDKLKGKLIEDQITYMLGTMFGLREIAAMFGVGNGYSGPAGARIISETVKLGKQAQQGEVDEAAIKAANNVGGILFHYPSGQINRTVAGAQAIADGEAGPQALLAGPPQNSR